MDLITLGMAKSYTDSQRIAYDENTVITWDGNTDGLTSIAPLGFPMYRVSDKLIPAGMVQVTVIDGRVLPDMAIEPLPGIVFALEGMMISAKTGEYAEGDAVISIPESGTYFAKPDSDNSVISVSFKTIHPIDPKFLPGVCLPVVELSTTLAHGVQFTNEESKLLKAAWEGGTPICVNCTLDLEAVGIFQNCSVVFSRAVNPISPVACVFFASFGGILLQIAAIGDLNGWIFSVK